MSGYLFSGRQEAIGKKNRFSVVPLLALFAFLLCALFPHHSYAKSNPRYGAIVMDADTGVILYQDRADKKLHPASLTKMMTLLLTFDALKKGKLRLNDRITISKRAAGAAPSKLGLEPGSTIRVEDAIYALVTKSANDIAVALAEHLGRTEENFARMMTRKAHTLGMMDTAFRNASGLHDPRQVSSARDISRLARTLIKGYPEYYHYFSTRTFTYQGKSYNNHNRLMNTYPGMDGLKTGYIQASGFNLAATAVQDGHRLIGVVFGGRTSHSRNRHMEEILNQGFAQIRRNNPPVLVAKAPSGDIKNIPIPTSKPDLDTTVLASLEKPAAPPPSERPRSSAGSIEIQAVSAYSDDSDDSDDDETSSRWALLDDPSKNNMFKRMIGEGDYDIAVRRRIETGLIAISALKEYPARPEKQTQTAPPAAIQSAAYRQSNLPQDWSIQIGAYTSRDATNKALANSLAALPMDLKHAYATVAPVKTEQGWIFRGRLKGYSRDNARRACEILKDCIALSPKTAP